MIEEIKEILKDNLSYVYCYNCKHNQYDENCDECHRKYMGWSISDECAEMIATKIANLKEKSE